MARKNKMVRLDVSSQDVRIVQRWAMRIVKREHPGARYCGWAYFSNGTLQITYTDERNGGFINFFKDDWGHLVERYWSGVELREQRAFDKKKAKKKEV
jgi:hypothetical protein